MLGKKRLFLSVNNGRRAQVATEQMILVGLILLLVIPLLYYITVVRTQTPYMGDAMGSLDNTVESLSNLGPGSGDTVVLRIPDGVKTASFTDCLTMESIEKCKAISVWYGDDVYDIFEMFYYVDGSLDFLRDPGMHYITLYNEGSSEEIIFQECGDGVVSGGEQCEACVNDEDCESGKCSDGVCTLLGEDILTACDIPGQGHDSSLKCIVAGQDFGCFCACVDGTDCLSGTCKPDTGGAYCASCEDDAGCGTGSCCYAGACKPADADADGSASALYCDDGTGIVGDDCDDTDGNNYPDNDETCDDGQDNNCNNLVDCADPDCSSYWLCLTCGDTEDDIAVSGGGGQCDQCSNGNDDDGDQGGWTTSPELTADNCDSDCGPVDGQTIGQNEWESFEETCGDNLDNDCDGFLDCADSDCVGDPVCGETSCDDGDDNDGDGLTDCADLDCDGQQGSGGLCEYGTESSCSDGFDNDGDGSLDCADSDCVDDPACIPQCSDGFDNDEDGFIDYGGGDLGCYGPNDADETNPVCGPNDIIVKLESIFGGHVEKWNLNNYLENWCYPYSLDKTHTCTGNVVIRAAFDASGSNAHVEKKGLSTAGYEDVCFGDIQCEYAIGSAGSYNEECSNVFQVNRACVGSISSDTNAHAGDCSEFSIKVCCTHILPIP